MQERDGGGFLGGFDPVRVATTSLAGKSETEVGFMLFRPRSRRCHLPRMQQRDGGGFCVVLSPFALPPPPSHARASRRWIFREFRPRSCRCHFPRIQQQVGCGFLWPFDPVRTATTWLFPDALGDHQGISSNDYRVSVRNRPILKLILSDCEDLQVLSHNT